LPDRHRSGDGTPLPDHDRRRLLLAMFHGLPLECEMRRTSRSVPPDVADGARRSGRGDASLNESRHAASDGL